MTTQSDDGVGATPPSPTKKADKGKLLSQLSIDQRDIRVSRVVGYVGNLFMNEVKDL